MRHTRLLQYTTIYLAHYANKNPKLPEWLASCLAVDGTDHHCALWLSLYGPAVRDVRVITLLDWDEMATILQTTFSKSFLLLWTLNSEFTGFYSQGPINHMPPLVQNSDNGWVPNRRYTMILTNDGSVYSCIKHASLLSNRSDSLNTISQLRDIVRFCNKTSFRMCHNFAEHVLLRFCQNMGRRQLFFSVKQKQVSALVASQTAVDR